MATAVKQRKHLELVCVRHADCRDKTVLWTDR